MDIIKRTAKNKEEGEVERIDTLNQMPLHTPLHSSICEASHHESINHSQSQPNTLLTAELEQVFGSSFLKRLRRSVLTLVSTLLL